MRHLKGFRKGLGTSERILKGSGQGSLSSSSQSLLSSASSSSRAGGPALAADAPLPLLAPLPGTGGTSSGKSSFRLARSRPSRAVQSSSGNKRRKCPRVLVGLPSRSMTCTSDSSAPRNSGDGVCRRAVSCARSSLPVMMVTWFLSSVRRTTSWPPRRPSWPTPPPTGRPPRGPWSSSTATDRPPSRSPRRWASSLDACPLPARPTGWRG